VEKVIFVIAWPLDLEGAKSECRSQWEGARHLEMFSLFQPTHHDAKDSKTKLLMTCIAIGDLARGGSRAI